MNLPVIRDCVEGPEDWETARDHYLYGTPKKQKGPDS